MQSVVLEPLWLHPHSSISVLMMCKWSNTIGLFLNTATFLIFTVYIDKFSNLSGKEVFSSSPLTPSSLSLFLFGSRLAPEGIWNSHTCYTLLGIAFNLCIKKKSIYQIPNFSEMTEQLRDHSVKLQSDQYWPCDSGKHFNIMYCPCDSGIYFNIR